MTMAWWNDLWLNEASATNLEYFGVRGASLSAVDLGHKHPSLHVILCMQAAAGCCARACTVPMRAHTFN